MFGFVKKILKDGKILALAEIAVEDLVKGDTENSERYFKKLSEYPIEDIQRVFMDNIKLNTETGDIDEILESTTMPLPDNSLELITLVWKDDLTEIMALMDNDPGKFIGTFASIMTALNDSSKKRNVK